MTRFPERLPFALSSRLASATASIYDRQGREVDVAIGGIPFRLATNAQDPQDIETIPVRKDQFDTEQDPGEQSLGNWWRRSQASFHEGAGLIYQEDQSGNPSFGYYDSDGIDVFTTKGQFTLLRRMYQNNTAGSFSRLRAYGPVTARGLTAINGGALYKSSTVTGTLASLHAPAGKTVVDGMVSGPQFYDVASDGTLYSGTVASPGTATSWPLGATADRLMWGKSRLWVIGGPKIWQPNLALAAGTAQTPIFTNPDAGWTYTCMAEGPGAMYFGGNNGEQSVIQAVTFATDGSGSVPSLSGATVTAVLPNGELVQKLGVLAGTLFGIGTSRGFRVGAVNIYNGAIEYGPNLLPDATANDIVACTALTTQGRYFIVAFQTGSGDRIAYRIDTGTQLDQSQTVYPYAKDIRCGTSTGYIESLATVDNKSMLACTSDGRLWYQSATDYVDSGYLQSGRIRYRTTERKLFKYLGVETDVLNGHIACDLILEGGSTLNLGDITTQNDVFNDQFAIVSPVGPMRYVSVRFTLTPPVGNLGLSPVIHSYLLKAIPAVPPQRMINLPLLCFDYEEARSGQRYGGKGYASDRLAAMQALEDACDTITYQDYSSSIHQGQTVVIDAMKFVQTSPAPPWKADGGGGILMVQLRTVSQ